MLPRLPGDVSKPDAADMLRSSRRCPTIIRLDACSRSTSHYMDSSDPPGHGNTGDWCSVAGSWQIGLTTNRNGGMLRLNASRHAWMLSRRFRISGEVKSSNLEQCVTDTPIPVPSYHIFALQTYNKIETPVCELRMTLAWERPADD